MISRAVIAQVVCHERFCKRLGISIISAVGIVTETATVRSQARSESARTESLLFEQEPDMVTELMRDNGFNL
ncbi:MAG TPA: hypothetical protein VFH48_30165 [Chloroflexota bacterium]|nr:hypothetical protein [Chloroflexota bacterium]